MSSQTQPDGIGVEFKDGRLQIVMYKGGAQTGSMPIAPRQLGGIAAMLLAAAHNHETSDERPEIGGKFTGQPLLARGAGLAVDQSGQRCILVLQVGVAQIGFELPTATLAELGRSLQAASADARGKQN